VMLWGGSAGGHLAALAATSCGVAAFAPQPSTGRMPHAEMAAAQAPSASECVQAAAIWYGVFDLSPHVLPGNGADEINNSDGIVTGLLGCDPKQCPAKAIAASPIHYLTAKTPPMLLIHGTADTTVSYHQSERMAHDLRQAGVPVETLFLPGLNHGLMSKDAEQTRAANLQALQRTFEFFDAKAGLHS
jgi:acetyl esterase/lipase